MDGKLMKITANVKPNTITPANQYNIDLNIQNNTNTPCRVTEIVVIIPDLKFKYKEWVDWNLGPMRIGLIPTSKSYSIPISPYRRISNGKMLGNHPISVKVKMQEGIDLFNSKSRWVRFDPIYIQVSPGREFKAFVSRSIRPRESGIPDKITMMLKKWGFIPTTIGIPPNDNITNLKSGILQEIENSDVIFVIATKRDKIINPFGWRASEWLQSESGMACARKKIVYVLKQYGVKLSGIAGEYPIITFSRWNLKGLESYFDENMIEIRNAVADKKNSKYLMTALKGAAIVGGFAIIRKYYYESGRKRGRLES